MTDIETKVCSKCKKTKPIDDFYKSQCSRCYNYQKNYYQENSEKVIAKINEGRDKKPEQYAKWKKEYNQRRTPCPFCKWDVLTHTWNKHIKSQNHLLNVKMVEEGLDEAYYKKARDEIFRGVWEHKPND